MFLGDEDKVSLQQRAEALQREQHQRFLRCQELVERYYNQLLNLKSVQEGKTLNWKEQLCDGLRCQKEGKIQKLSPSSRRKALDALRKMKHPSEMTFMSFFHTVSKLLRAYGVRPPRPSEILELQKLLFGRKYVTTCRHNVALLAYTLGLLDETELNSFEVARSEQYQQLDEAGEHIPPEQACSTTILFEQYLDRSADTLEDFRSLFGKRKKLKSELELKKHLRESFIKIFKCHGGNPRSPVISLEQYGCAHMADTLRNRVLDEQSSEIPSREWFLALGLYMDFQADEVDQLLKQCGYVPIGFDPWEEGLRYLLSHPAGNIRERLDRRESMFLFMKHCGFDPPPEIFAAFPHLAAQPGNSDHALLASLLLNCCAQVRPIREGLDMEYRADFYEPSFSRFSWSPTGPDLLDIFYPKRGCLNLTAQLREVLDYTSRAKLPPLRREEPTYQKASEKALEWQERWRPAEVQTSSEEQVMWGVLAECETNPVNRRKFMYAVFLYIIYTGHLPMKNNCFPADFVPSKTRSDRSGLRFLPQDEAITCRDMAASFLNAL